MIIRQSRSIIANIAENVVICMISNIFKKDHSIILEFDEPIGKLELFEQALRIRQEKAAVIVEPMQNHYMVGSRFLPNHQENFRQRKW